MTFDGLTDYLQSLPNAIMDAAPDIVAETATEHFKDSFTKKAFDGNPWAPAKVPRKNGSLLVDSGNLVNSIRPAYIGRDKVIISAGNDKVGYAQVHNEGYTGPMSVPQHTRKTTARTINVPEYTRKGKSVAAHSWAIPGGNVSVKAHTRQVDIPQRQFMGESNELAETLKNKLQDYINSTIK